MSSIQWLANIFKGSKKARNRANTNSKKFTNRKADELKLQNISAQFFFLQGSGSGKYDCQDTYGLYAKNAEDFSFYAVFDGHGTSGKEASNSACDFMLGYVDKNYSKIMETDKDSIIEGILQDMFIRADESLKTVGVDMDLSGTTCVCILAKDTSLYIASAGDSRAVLARISNGYRFAIELTQDHRPYVESERNRIIKSGGYVRRIHSNDQAIGPYRIWADDDGPGLALTRSLGDFQVKKIGMISTPQIQKINLKDADQFVVIATDGLWEVMSSTEVIAFIIRLGEERSQAARQLVVEARNIWYELNRIKHLEGRISDSPSMRFGIDDISVIILFFSFEGIEPVFSPKQKDPLTSYKLLKEKGVNVTVEQATGTKDIKIKDVSHIDNSLHSIPKDDLSIEKVKALEGNFIKSNPGTPKENQDSMEDKKRLDVIDEETPHSRLGSQGKQADDFRIVPQSSALKQAEIKSQGGNPEREKAESYLEDQTHRPLIQHKKQEGLIPVEYDLDYDVDLEDDLLPPNFIEFAQGNYLDKFKVAKQGYKNETRHQQHPSTSSMRPLNDDL